MKPLYIAVTMGDPSGVGPEVLVKALRRVRRIKDAAFFVIGDPVVFRRAGFRASGNVRLVACSGAATPAAASLFCLEEAVRLLRAGSVHALVTAPVSKKNIQGCGVAFTGHTEFLMENFGVKEVAMVFAGAHLKVALVTRHMSLREAVRRVTRQNIVACGRLSLALLRDRFKIKHPRIAVCGLNPHAGEQGLFGDEEALQVAPAVRQLNRSARGVFSGPWPADTVFYRAMHGDFDLVLAMYHDQGLSVFKAVDFLTGAQISAGLPFVRTSPVHGTGFDIAGKGIADAGSMEAALRLAVSLGLKSGGRGLLRQAHRPERGRRAQDGERSRTNVRGAL